MLLDRTADGLRERLPALFRCMPHADGVVLVVTPLVMPDGSMVTVFVDETGDCPRVTDYGDTLGMLPMMAPRCEQLPHIPRLAKEAARVPGVALENGELVAHIRENDNLVDLVVAVAQASLRVSCLVYACRDPGERDIYGDLADLFRDAGVEVERSGRRTGASGREWIIDFATKGPGPAGFLVIVTGGNAAQASAVAEHTAQVIDDVRRGCADPHKFVALFDDTDFEWPDAALRRLAEQAEVVPWSRRSDLPRVLVADAVAAG